MGVYVEDAESLQAVTGSRASAGSFRDLGVVPVIGRGFRTGGEGPKAFIWMYAENQP